MIFESGFTIKLKAKGDKMSIKISKGFFYAVHRTKINKSKVKICVKTKSADMFKDCMYIYVLGDKIVYSNSMINSSITMPLYLIESVFSNGVITDYNIIDQRGMLLS